MRDPSFSAALSYLNNNTLVVQINQHYRRQATPSGGILFAARSAIARTSLSSFQEKERDPIKNCYLPWKGDGVEQREVIQTNVVFRSFPRGAFNLRSFPRELIKTTRCVVSDDAGDADKKLDRSAKGIKGKSVNIGGVFSKIQLVFFQIRSVIIDSVPPFFG